MGGTSTTKTENKPPAWSAPLFKQSAQEAQELYNQGIGGNTYTGSTVSDLSGTTMEGVNQLANAGQNWDTSGTRPIYQQLGAGAVSNPYTAAMGGLAGQVDPDQVGTSMYDPAKGTASGLGGYAEDLFGGVSSGQDGITNGSQYQGVYDRAGQPTSAAANLSGMASGENLLSNPYFNDALQGQLDKTADRVQSLFSGAGRYGSGANTEALTDSLGNIRANALFNQYNQDLQNQLAANGMIDTANNAAAGTQLNAAAGLSGVQNQNIGNRLTASGQMLGAQNSMANLLKGIGDSEAGVLASDADRGLAGQQLQGNLLSNAGNLYQSGIGQGLNAANAMAGLDQQNFENQLAGAGATLQAGGIVDNQAQKQLQDYINQFYASDNQDWTRLGLLQSAAAGSAGDYGTQVSKTRQPFNPMSLIQPAATLFGGK